MTSNLPIHLENVSFFHGRGKLRKQILHEVSLDIEAGEVVILSGPSGSGKSTVLTLIGALRSAQEGVIDVLGHKLRGAKESELVGVRKQIGYIFQEHNLLASLTVEHNIQMALSLSGTSRSSWRERVEHVLEQVGMDEHIHKLPSELSGGQKQRIGVARALINHPKIILADEPTASLDKESGRDVVELIQRLSKEEGAAVVLVTHDNRILDLADRIVSLEDGVIKSLGEVVGENTSRMLNILARHEPDASKYLAAFSIGLTRVANADKVVTEDEVGTIKDILNNISDLQPGEVDLVMELARAQLGLQLTVDGEASFSEEKRQHFIDALHAVAEADGETSAEEKTVISDIASELGFKQD